MKVAQLLDMQHAIGYDVRLVNRNKFIASRNYFTTSGRSEDWDDLVEQGLATRTPFPKGWGYDPYVYRVSEKGFEELEKILHIKIEMEE